MGDVVHQQFSVYRVGAAAKLSDEVLSLLAPVFGETSAGQPPGLEGRRRLSKVRLPGIGAVVVKHYRRGGALARVNKARYLRWGKPRSQVEFEQMAAAASVGVNVPAPIAFAYEGKLFYRAWLVTAEIENQQTLANISRHSPERIPALMTVVQRQVARLVDHSLWHVDLHPGNVLVTAENRIFLVDFDKARSFCGAADKLKAAYHRRWKRAVKKHQLASSLLPLWH